MEIDQPHISLVKEECFGIETFKDKVLGIQESLRQEIRCAEKDLQEKNQETVLIKAELKDALNGVDIANKGMQDAKIEVDEAKLLYNI